eukprot:TRINITY_DN28997_c0_g1_i1.p1 TRINITY_DN28997_c0_g1~~TRINITY_DN28997_c0_g1_i1.p1  ORF type:complete len:146 (+),score=25.07 TRINITY_DN28997_c0_g1_i1:217-654(+)
MANEDAIIAELEELAKRVFEEKGFDPDEAFERLMEHLDELAEASFSAMNAAAEELYQEAETLLFDAGRVFDNEASKVESSARADLTIATANKLELAAIKAHSAAESAARMYLKAILSSTSAATAVALADAFRKKMNKKKKNNTKP